MINLSFGQARINWPSRGEGCPSNGDNDNAYLQFFIFFRRSMYSEICWKMNSDLKSSRIVSRRNLFLTITRKFGIKITSIGL